MRVIHVAPTAFGKQGLFGGGERYPLELARALAQHVSCELVTFGPKAGVHRDGALTIRVVRPLGYLGGHPARAIAPGLPRAIGPADIVHVHHIRAPTSMLAALTAHARGIATVATDHGLGEGELGRLGQRLLDRTLAVSRYSARQLGSPPGRTRIVYGGADPQRHRPNPGERRAGVLFVGRLTPTRASTSSSVPCLPTPDSRSSAARVTTLEHLSGTIPRSCAPLRPSGGSGSSAR